MRAAFLSVIGFLMLGAAAHAQPYIYHGNDTGGIIPWSCENEAMAQQAAAAYCARWDKYHRVQLPVVALHQPLRPAGGTDPIQLLLSARTPADHQVIRP